MIKNNLVGSKILNRNTYLCLRQKELEFNLSRIFNINDKSSIKERSNMYDEVEAHLTLFDGMWRNDPLPVTYFQVSTGIWYTTEDELFLSLNIAIETTILLSTKHLDTYYIIWCYETYKMPYPIGIVLNGTYFERE